jgi:uncharacterized protein
MSLEETINADIKTAMLAKESTKLEALRAIKAALILLKTSGEAQSPELEIKTLQKMVKQRKETALLYEQQNRSDLADVEQAQALIIEKYLPAQMTETELEAVVKQIIASLGISNAAEKGKAIGAANKQLAGKADGKAIAEMVNRLLQ